jgi:hypothetical protein
VTQAVQPPEGGAPAATAPQDALDALERYATRGRNAELILFESQLSPERWRTMGRPVTIWQFIEDACYGTGGFADGSYLIPFRLEMESEIGIQGVSAKYRDRMAIADYDRFAGHICGAPWDLIVSQRTFRWDSADDRVNAFWEDCDGKGTRLLDFAEYPHLQARRYGTAVCIVDREAAELRSEAENLDPANAPYVYSFPTYFVMDWRFGEDGDLEYLVFAIPEEGQSDVFGQVTVRVWTEESVTTFRPSKQRTRAKGTDDFFMLDTRPNPVGMVPAVLWYNELPSPGRFLAPSEMYDVAKKGQTYFNLESEAREIQRKCASPFLYIPVKDSNEYDAEPFVIGSETAITGDGTGAPQWIQPNLSVLAEIREQQKKKKDEAYGDAGLRALVADIIKTSSGLHAEVEFSKTERRVARHSSMGEMVCTRLTILVLRYLGMMDAGEAKKLFTVTWPKEFGVRDLDKMLDRAQKEIALGIGPEFNAEFLTDYARARFPRKTGTEIEILVKAAVKYMTSTRQRLLGAGGTGAQPKPVEDKQLDVNTKGLGGLGVAENGG